MNSSIDQPTARDAWASVFSHVVRAGEAGAKHFLGAHDHRRCRFCLRSEAETTFRSESHVIPAAFGNRSLFSYEECDDCNQVGSRLEDDLAKFLSLPRAISRLPARKGTPKIRHPNERAYVKWKRQTNEVHVHLPDDDEGIRVEDDGEGKLRLTIDMPKHRPINVAKALGRMLFFAIDVDEPGFERIREWVRGEVDWFPIPIVILFFPGVGYNRVQLMIHRYTEYPDRRILRVGLMYSSFLLTMPLPMDEWSLPSDLRLLNYPQPYTQTLLNNTSVQWVTDNMPVINANSEAVFTYKTRTGA